MESLQTNRGPIDDKEIVDSFVRGLSVIRAFGKQAPELTLSEVASRCDLTRAAARRFLLTLVKLGYATTDGKHFRLSARILDLGYAYLSSLDLTDIALPIMERVSTELHESTSISVLNGTEIVYVARVPTRRIMSVTLNIGTRLPAYCTSMGRVLLAGLCEADLDVYFGDASFTAFTAHTLTDPARLRAQIAEDRRKGWSLVDEELELGLRSLSVPIRNARGNTVAAMNISGHAARVTCGVMIDTYLPVLKIAQADIERALGIQTPS